MLDKAIVAAFWRHVSKWDDPRGCWQWHGAQPAGYPLLWFDSICYQATHISWEIHHGAPPSQMMLHHCDNPECANPDHLFDGDAGANARDMVAKGRHHPRARNVGRRAVAELRDAGYLQIGAAAAHISIAAKELREAHRKGRLSGARVLGALFFHHDDLEAWASTPEAIRAQRHQAGLCYDCGEPCGDCEGWCASCFSMLRKTAKAS